MRAITRRATIDWNDVHKRVQNAESAISQAIHPDLPSLAATFERRARQLAERRSQGSAADAALILLIFRAGSERLALELKHVVEVGPLKRITPVTGASSGLIGVFAHRGEVRSVVDLNRILGCLQERETPFTHFIHIRGSAGDALIGATELEGILKITEQERLAASNQDAGLPSEIVSGFTRQGVVILSIDSVLTRIDGRSRPGAACPQSQDKRQEHAS